MTITFAEHRRESLRTPDRRALSLEVSLEEGDPQDIQLTLAELANVQDALFGTALESRLECLLPQSGDLTLAVLCKAAQLLGLRLRVITQAEEKQRSEAFLQGKFPRLPKSPLLAMEPEDILWDRDLHSKPVVAGYLAACLGKGDETLLQNALRGVIACHRGGVKALAKRLHLQPEAIFEMLTGDGCPKVTGVLQLLRGLGYVLTAEVPRPEVPKRKPTRAAAEARPKPKHATRAAAEACAEVEQAAVALAK